VASVKELAMKLRIISHKNFIRQEYVFQSHAIRIGKKQSPEGRLSDKLLRKATHLYLSEKWDRHYYHAILLSENYEVIYRVCSDYPMYVYSSVDKLMEKRNSPSLEIVRNDNEQRYLLEAPRTHSSEISY
jgi:hypothetical protein